jgi:hypothetical protein
MIYTSLHVDRSAFIRLDPQTLNDQLVEIGIWVAKRNIPHKTRVSFQPERNRIRFDFSTAGEAQAFTARFQAVARFVDAELGAVCDQANV